MILEEAIEILKSHNEWRRGAEIEQIDPALIGQAIDRILTYSEYCLKDNKERAEKTKKFLLGEKEYSDKLKSFEK